MARTLSLPLDVALAAMKVMLAMQAGHMAVIVYRFFEGSLVFSK